MCGSDEWRQAIREVILPWVLGDANLGDDVLEVGPGHGATTDVLSKIVPRLTSVEIDGELAGMLRERFAEVSSVEIINGDATALPYEDEKFTGAASFTMLHHVPTAELQDRLFGEVARVLRSGAPLLASDSLGSNELAAHHEDDTYNPIDPTSLPELGCPLHPATRVMLTRSSSPWLQNGGRLSWCREPASAQNRRASRRTPSATP